MKTFENDLPNDIFLFGASYAPYALGEDWPMDEWEQDIKNMLRLNFNTIRVFAAWPYMEIERDKYDFTKLDHIFSLAEKYGIRVIINFGGLFTSLCGCGKPWYMRDVEPWCKDNPAVRERAFLFMSKVVARYAPHKNLFAWMTWNEPDAGKCTCEHTIARFRGWLKERYKTIDALNKAWGGGRPVRFASFDEINGTEGDCIAPRMDMARFRQWSLAADMEEVSELARKLDPQCRPTTANLVYHRTAQEGPSTLVDSGMNTALDGQAMSIMGVSCYTIEHYYDPMPAYTVSFKLSRLRGASADVKRRMLTLETGAGPNIREHSRQSREALMWQQIGQNVKCLLAWNYRSRVDGGQVGLFHLTAFDGSITPRAESFGKLGARLQKHAALLNRVYPKNAAAILTLEDTLTLLGINYPESVHASQPMNHVQESRFGAYRLMYDCKIGADCICETTLDRLNDYKVLLLPAQEQMTPDAAKAIRDYVWNGGTVIAEGPFGFRNENGRLQYHFPGCGLEEVFGGFSRDRNRETGETFYWKGASSKAGDFICAFESAGADIVAVWSDGRPAVMENHFGKGRAIMYGTEVFRKYAQDASDPVGALLKRQVSDAGLAPVLNIQGEAENVEVAALYGDVGEKVWILINHSSEQRNFRICSEEPLVTLEGNALEGPVTLGVKEVLVLKNLM